METELYKVRSLSSCMKAAYDMFSTNIKTIFRRTWLPAVVAGIIGGLSPLVFYNIAYQLPSVAAFSSSSNIATTVSGLVLTVLAIAAYVWFDAIIVSLLNGSSMKANLPRVIRLALLVVAITVCIAIIDAAASLIPLIGKTQKNLTPETLNLCFAISIAVYVIFVIAVLPLLFSSMKYLMEPKQKLLSVVGRQYKAGWRHWGYIFMLCLLSCIICSIIYLIAALPSTITGMAVITDAKGMALGDAAGLPGYFMPLACVATFIAWFIMVYVGAWFTIVMYYAYGHIEAREQARAERRTAIKNVAEKEVEPDFEEVK